MCRKRWGRLGINLKMWKCGNVELGELSGLSLVVLIRISNFKIMACHLVPGSNYLVLIICFLCFSKI